MQQSAVVAVPPESTSEQAPTTQDRDCDGILDMHDRCPEEAEDLDGYEDQDGCQEPDNDRDSIVDQCDQCPNEPEVFNGFEDEDGCPDRSCTPPMFDAQNIRILHTVRFAHNSSRIRPNDFPLLEAIVRVMAEMPRIRVVAVDGHASNTERAPQRLSLARAQAVLRYLVAHGVQAERLQARGLGATQPLADDRTAEGQSLNRRVYFMILEPAEQPPAPPPPPPQPPNDPDGCPGGHPTPLPRTLCGAGNRSSGQ